MLSNLDTYLEALRTSPLEFLLTLVYAVAVILISLILHECAHGYVAYRCGDPTAKMMGRLSLNPKAHLDLIGTLSMFLIGVGWAKPVPVNPRNFRHGRRDDFFVSIAGIATNLCLCLICMFLSVVVGKSCSARKCWGNSRRAPSRTCSARSTSSRMAGTT